MPVLSPDFGDRLRAARAYVDLSQAEFAGALNTDGASESTLKLWEKGTRRPTAMLAPELVRRLALVSGLPEEFFWGEPAEPGPLTAAEALDQIREATRVIQEMQATLDRLTRDAEKRDLQSRRGTGPSPESPSNAA